MRFEFVRILGISQWQNTIFDLLRIYLINATICFLATLEPLGPPTSNYPTCQSPIFNHIEKLRLDDSLNDDLEDINNLIDTEVGVENLQQNQYEDPSLLATFQCQQEPSSKIKVIVFAHLGKSIFSPVLPTYVILW